MASTRTCVCDWGRWETCDKCNPDERDVLRAEVARLEREKDSMFSACEQAGRALIAAEAEVARLTKILAGADDSGVTCSTCGAAVCTHTYSRVPDENQDQDALNAGRCE
jgi:hypothetical protein